eukprot:NODE_9_length_64580_cov_1.431941.p14 type:complete len:417 gc:universal NODE_9_length_64580_cov_1.431941:23178-21928(-)
MTKNNNREKQLVENEDDVAESILQQGTTSPSFFVELVKLRMYKAIKAALEYGDDPTKPRDIDALDPYRAALDIHFDEKVIELFLSYDFIPPVDSYGYNILHILVMHNKPNLLPIVISKFPKYLNQKTLLAFSKIPAQSTPLHIAVIKNFKDCSWILLQAGADVFAPDKNNRRIAPRQCKGELEYLVQDENIIINRQIHSSIKRLKTSMSSSKALVQAYEKVYKLLGCPKPDSFAIKKAASNSQKMVVQIIKEKVFQAIIHALESTDSLKLIILNSSFISLLENENSGMDLVNSIQNLKVEAKSFIESMDEYRKVLKNMGFDHIVADGKEDLNAFQNDPSLSYNNNIFELIKYFNPDFKYEVSQLDNQSLIEMIHGKLPELKYLFNSWQSKQLILQEEIYIKAKSLSSSNEFKGANR